MKRRYPALLLLLVMLFSLMGSGCNSKEKINEIGNAVAESAVNKDTSAISGNDKSSKSDRQQPDTNSNRQSNSVKNNNSGQYTMRDIYRLNNTEHFAGKTLEHIFDGTINSKGKATGYHYSMVSDSKGSIISGTRSQTDENGVFTAKVKVKNVRKNGFSSFYPENWTPQQVVDAINVAYEDAVSDSSNPKGSLWIGHYKDLEIDMYLDNNKKITTAFPVYEGD